jgi:hypothetical protein
MDMYACCCGTNFASDLTIAAGFQADEEMAPRCETVTMAEIDTYHT